MKKNVMLIVTAWTIILISAHMCGAAEAYAYTITATAGTGGTITPGGSVTVNEGGSNLIAAVNGGRLYTSSDSGVNWTERRPAGDFDKGWQSVASDSDGSNLIVCYSRLYTSSDYGATWTERRPAGDFDKEWYSVASDSDGSYLIAGTIEGYLYTSSDSGVNWTERQPAGSAYTDWRAADSDADGSHLIAANDCGFVHTSSDYGATWTKRRPNGVISKNWRAVASDDDGSNLIAGHNAGRLYTSSDYGATWIIRRPDGVDTNKSWNAVASDKDGLNLIAGIFNLSNGRLYTSSDSGVNWTERQPAGDTNQNWSSVASDSDGSNLIAGIYGGGYGRLYTSSDSGVNWTERRPAGNFNKEWYSVASDSGGSLTFTIAANTGYAIADVLVDGISVGAVASYTFSNVTANHTIAASFAINTYTLIITSPNGSVIRTPDKPTYTHGETVTLTATADSGFVFDVWTGNAQGSENPITITMDSNKTISADFIKEVIYIDGPGMLDQEGATYVLTGDLAVAGTYFTIAADNITFDLGGHTITGPQAYAGNIPCISVDGFNNVTIKNGKIKGGFNFGIRLRNTQGNIVANIVEEGPFCGIYLQSSSNNQILNNTLNYIGYPAGAYQGILLASSPDNTVNGNTICSCIEGIDIDSSPGSRIINNVISFNVGTGISVDSSSNSVILSNTMDPIGVGIFSRLSSSLEIKSNTIKKSEQGISGTEGGGNVVADNFIESSDYERFGASLERTITAGVPVNFSMSISNINKIPCPGFHVNEITVSPAENIQYSIEGNNLETSFTPSRDGLYSMYVSLTDDLNNTLINRFYFGDKETIRLYFRKMDGCVDYGYLLTEPPVEIEERHCARVIEFAPHELHDIAGISQIINIYALFDYRGGENIGGLFFGSATRIFPFVTQDVLGYRKALPGTAYQRTSMNLEFSKWIYNDWNDYKNVILQLLGSSPSITTQPQDPGYADITYLYTTKPVVRAISNDNVLLLSATMDTGNQGAASLVLQGKGTTDISVGMPDTTKTYEIFYDGVSAIDNPDCVVNNNSNGMIDVTINLESLHVLEVRSAGLIYGDVDGIPGITAQDALVTLKHAAGIITLTGDALEAADVDDTDHTTTPGDVTGNDALLILQYSAGIIDAFPVEGS